MKDKKILVLIFAALLLIFIILFLSRSVKIETADLKKAAGPLKANALKLEAQVNQLQDLIHSFVRMNISMKENLAKEKAQNAGLNKVLEEITLQNETLSGKLSQTNYGLELTQTLRKKLAEIEKSLSSLKLNPSSERELKNLLDASNRKLDLISFQLPAIINEKRYYKDETENLKQSLGKKDKDIVILKTRSEEEKGKIEALSKKLALLSTELQLLKNTAEALADKNANLEKIREDLSRINLSLNTESQRIAKEFKDAQARLFQALKEKDAAIEEQQKILNKQKTSEESVSGLAQANKAAEEELTRLKNELDLQKKEKEALAKELEEIKLAGQNAQRLPEELNKLRTQLERTNKDYAGLKDEAKINMDMFKQNAAELSRRAEKIIALSEQASDAQAKLNETLDKSKDLEKDAAVLREENVGLRIGRETLNQQLEETRLQLSQLENQASQINSILKGAALQAGSPHGEAEGRPAQIPQETKKIEVEVYPFSDTAANPAGSVSGADDTAAPKIPAGGEKQ